MLWFQQAYFLFYMYIYMHMKWNYVIIVVGGDATDGIIQLVTLVCMVREIFNLYHHHSEFDGRLLFC